MQPVELLSEARRLLDEPDPSTVSAWARASAVLARQALEAALSDYWQTRAPGVEYLNMRAQLNCARVYLPADTAADLCYAWYALSRATHHHPYELDPTREELSTLVSRSYAAVQVLETYKRTAAARDDPAGINTR